MIRYRLHPVGWPSCWDLTRRSCFVDVGSGYGKVAVVHMPHPTPYTLHSHTLHSYTLHTYTIPP